MAAIKLRIIIWIMTGSAVLLSGMRLPPQISKDREYQLKAVFLFNFSQFVEWPASAFPDANTAMVIGILGEDPFGPYLDGIVSGEKINNRPLVVRRFATAEDVRECHILFINLKAKDELRKAFNAVKSQSVLTVGDGDSFVRNGGMIRFVKESNKIRIRIDPATTSEAGLTISPKLLRLAEIYSPK